MGNFNFDFNGFEQELAKHFKGEHHIVTEDLIRYWFIGCHKDKNGLSYTEVPYIRLNGPKTPLRVNEYKPKLKPIIHKNNKESYRVRADLYYGDIEANGEDLKDNLDCVFEFKYHRRTRYSDCCTGTDCGSVFGDLNRLSILKNKEKYFIYVFDDNMYDEYYKNKEENIFSIFKELSAEQKNPKNISIGNDFDKTVFGKSFPKAVKNFGEIKAVKNFGEIKKGAFSQFNGSYSFADFDYQVNILYSKKICDVSVTEWGNSNTKSYYLIICQVV